MSLEKYEKLKKLFEVKASDSMRGVKRLRTVLKDMLKDYDEDNKYVQEVYSDFKMKEEIFYESNKAIISLMDMEKRATVKLAKRINLANRLGLSSIQELEEKKREVAEYFKR